MFQGRYTHVRVLLPKDLCNRSLGFSALVVREETPSPLPVGCSIDILPELTREHCLVEAPGYHLILLLSVRRGSSLLGGPFRIGVLYQARVETPLSEIHPPC